MLINPSRMITKTISKSLCRKTHTESLCHYIHFNTHLTQPLSVSGVSQGGLFFGLAEIYGSQCVNFMCPQLWLKWNSKNHTGRGSGGVRYVVPGRRFTHNYNVLTGWKWIVTINNIYLVKSYRLRCYEILYRRNKRLMTKKSVGVKPTTRVHDTS